MGNRLTGWWAGLSGPQQVLVGLGVPAAAGAAIIANVRDRPEPSGAVPDPGVSLMATNADVVADFGLLRELIRLDTQDQLDDLEDRLTLPLEESEPPAVVEPPIFREPLLPVFPPALVPLPPPAPVPLPPPSWLPSTPVPLPSSLPSPSPGVITGAGVHPGGVEVSVDWFAGIPGITDQDLANLYAFYGTSVPAGPAAAILERAAVVAAR